MISFINSLHVEIKETSDCGFDTITLEVKQFIISPCSSDVSVFFDPPRETKFNASRPPTKKNTIWAHGTGAPANHVANVPAPAFWKGKLPRNWRLKHDDFI